MRGAILGVVVVCIVLPTQAGVEVGDCLVEVCGEPVYQMHHQKVE